jgi:hypothetical protein
MAAIVSDCLPERGRAVKRFTLPSTRPHRSARAQASREQELARFQERLKALERECQLFRTYDGWQDESHRARALGLLRELSALERLYSGEWSPRLQLAFVQQNLLLRYQTFKRTYRQFWELLTGQ